MTAPPHPSDRTHATPRCPAADPPAAGGRLAVVGIGPGALDLLTPRARAAIRAADSLIGHGRYLQLIAPLVRNQQVLRRGMTEELARARLAADLAGAGQRVALISSGDSGIYGMASLTYQVLFQQGWHPGADPVVEVIPGISALNACAALVGAPLGHDFCAISLSDLLTPWPVIARRLAAAAAADFVIALYNPASGRRTRQLPEAGRLLRCYRPGHTPVALVQGAYRPDQQVSLTTLDALDRHPVGMTTSVLIGNRQTQVRDGLLITPRGYTDRYALDTGAPFPGETGGQSRADGLAGWQAAVRASGQDATSLAHTWELPVDYLAAVLEEARQDAVSGD
ncbi:MAG: precorrin-3B C(17)-methyltransferase [Chromatiaceae bacterium]|nr:MAG: precorrin-3B C(17)-methyltransferase [Chromatiaceae bacterium]